MIRKPIFLQSNNRISSLCILVFAASWLPQDSSAEVQLRTNIQDIHYQGPCTEAGPVTMVVDSNEFPNSTQTNPTFVVLRMALGAKLCQSLVNVDGPETSHYPIHLAMRLETYSQDATISAPPNTISIVRWIRGESAIWLRVSNPSNTWVTYEGTQRAPSPDIPVAWTFGQTARRSYDRNSWWYEDGRSNRIANGRAGGELPMEQFNVSTLLAVDVSDSHMQPMPEWNSALGFDVYQADVDFELLRTIPPPANFDPRYEALVPRR